MWEEEMKEKLKDDKLKKPKHWTCKIGFHNYILSRVNRVDFNTIVGHKICNMCGKEIKRFVKSKYEEV